MVDLLNSLLTKSDTSVRRWGVMLKIRRGLDNVIGN